MRAEAIRTKVIEAALDCQDKGLIHGTSGNVSMVDREEGIMVITPSSIDYKKLTPELIPIVSLDTGEWIDGPYKPSIELSMHLAILRAKAKMTAVVHTHSLYATVVSLFLDELPPIAAASAPYSPVKVAPFRLPGTVELAECAVEAMGDHNVVCLLKNHGLIASGPTMERAISIAEYIEENAQTAYLAYVAGHMVPLPEKESKIMRDRAVKRMNLD